MRTIEQYKHQREARTIGVGLVVNAPDTDQMFKEIIDVMWTKYDEDGNGVIDKFEFIVFMEDLFGGDLNELVRKSEMDLDFNDSVDREL